MLPSYFAATFVVFSPGLLPSSPRRAIGRSCRWDVVCRTDRRAQRLPCPLQSAESPERQVANTTLFIPNELSSSAVKCSVIRGNCVPYDAGITYIWCWRYFVKLHGFSIVGLMVDSFKKDDNWCRRIRDIVFIIACILLPCQNLVTTLPIMQLDHFIQVCYGSSSKCSTEPRAVMRSGLQRPGKLLPNSTSPDLFHFQTCSLQTQQIMTEVTSLEDIYQIYHLCSGLWGFIPLFFFFLYRV